MIAAAGALVLCGVALVGMFLPGLGVLATYGNWTAVARSLAFSVALWGGGTALVAWAARGWPRIPRVGSPASATGAARWSSSFAPAVALMVAGLGALAIALLFLSPLTCYGPMLYHELPACALPGAAVDAAYLAALLGGATLAVGLGWGLGFAFQPRSRPAAAVCAAVLLVTAAFVGGLALVPPNACAQGCAGSVPLGTAFELGPGSVLATPNGTAYSFPITWAYPEVAVAYSQLEPSVVSSDESSSPVTAGAGWSVEAIAPGNHTIASFDLATETWSSGSGTTARTGDSLLLVCPGSDVAGRYLEVGTSYPGWSGSVWSRIP